MWKILNYIPIKENLRKKFYDVVFLDVTPITFSFLSCADCVPEETNW